jgi:hypothetical protein
MGYRRVSVSAVDLTMSSPSPSVVSSDHASHLPSGDNITLGVLMYFQEGTSFQLIGLGFFGLTTAAESCLATSGLAEPGLVVSGLAAFGLVESCCANSIWVQAQSSKSKAALRGVALRRMGLRAVFRFIK